MKLGETSIIFNNEYCVEDPQQILDRLADLVGYRLEQNKRLQDADTSEAKG